MRSRRISKRVLVSPEGTIMVWACPLPVIVCASFRKGRALAGDGRIQSCLSTRAIVESHSDNRTENAPEQGAIDMFLHLSTRDVSAAYGLTFSSVSNILHKSITYMYGAISVSEKTQKIRCENAAATTT
ncbi:hypothetical protein AVEN_155216-1 [Araneus ventricosus]|uniref:Uncharacterized protein n=1 Tax=Araneus ventricosus TaxID=182803 RepID=A0A4Y2EJE4_ARAVE|nr:hypothetical protein AVEN_155216-1 [Araneus ventricosus]